MKKGLGYRFISAAMIMAVSFSSNGLMALATSGPENSDEELNLDYEFTDEEFTDDELTGEELIEDELTQEEFVEEEPAQEDLNSWHEENSVRSGDYTYTVSDSEATIQYYWGESGIVNIPETIDGYKVTALGSSVFLGNEVGRITEVTVPDTVTVIGDSAFSNCTNMTKVTLSKNLVELGKSAFAGCISITEIEFPDTLESIGADCFSSSKGLKEIFIPKSVTQIGGSAFPYVEKIIFEEGMTAISGFACSCARDLKEVVIPDSVVSIGDYAFSQCEALTEIDLPDNLQSIGKRAFQLCGVLKDVELPGSITSIGDCCFQYCNALEYLLVPKSLTQIGSGAFGTVKKIAFEEGTTEIPDNAACGCEEIIIPDTVTKIGKNSISGPMETITLPDSVTEIADNAFNCSKLKEIKLSKKLKSIGNSAFSGCRNLTTVELPESLESIGTQAFWRCPLESVVIPKSVTSIGGYCFRATKKVVFEEGTTEIPDNALYYADNMVEVVIPDTVKKIGEKAFGHCENLTGEVVPEGVEYIGSYAFAGCLLITGDIKLKDICEIGENAFYGCDRITGLECGDKLKVIGKSAFGSCNSLSKVVLGNDLVIEKYAFDYCRSLVEVVMGDDVVLEEGVFSYCPIVSFVFGKNLKYQKYSFEKPKTEGKTGNISYRMDSLDGGNLVITTDGDIPDYSFAFDDSVRLLRSFVKSVTLTGKIGKIGKAAFIGLNNLEYIVIPEGVTEIAEDAFYGSGATFLQIPATVTKIDASAFGGCGTLSDVYFCGKTAPEVATDAFDENTVTSVYYPQGSTGYGKEMSTSLGNAVFTEFGAGKEKRDIVILMDNKDRTKPIREAAASFISELSLADNNTRVAVIYYGGQFVEASSLSFSKGYIAKKIEDMGIGYEYTAKNDYTPAFKAADRILSGSDAENRSIIVFSQGGCYDSAATVKEKAKALRSKYSLYTVGVNPEEKGKKFLTSLAGDKSRYIEEADIKTLTEQFNSQISVFEVKFETNGAVTIDPVRVSEGCRVVKPADPEKEGYVFAGWYADEVLTEAWDFEGRSVSGDITLFAKWVLSEKDDEGNATGIAIEIADAGYPVYTGKAVKPAIVVRDGKKTLTEKTDYIVTLKNNIQACDADSEAVSADKKPVMEIKGVGAYEGKLNVTRFFTIEQADVATLDIKAPESLVVKKNNAATQLKIKVKYGKKAVPQDAYSISYFTDKELTEKVSSITASGEYFVVLEAKKEADKYTGNYKGSKVLKVSVAASDKLAGKAALKLNKSVKCEDTALSEDEAIRKVIKSIKFGKTGYTMKGEGIAEFKNNFDVFISDEEGNLYEKEDLWKGLEKSGKITVTVRAKEGNSKGYLGEISKELTVSGKKLKASMFRVTYVVGLDKPAMKANYNGRKNTPYILSELKAGSDYRVTYMRGKEVISPDQVLVAGNYKVVITGINNYSGTLTYKFTITK